MDESSIPYRYCMNSNQFTGVLTFSDEGGVFAFTCRFCSYTERRLLMKMVLMFQEPIHIPGADRNAVGGHDSFLLPTLSLEADFRKKNAEKRRLI